MAENLAPDAARDRVAFARAAFDKAFVGIVAIAAAMLLVTAALVGLVSRPRAAASRNPPA